MQEQPNATHSTLLENLKKLMGEAKLTIDKLSADTGVPVQTIKRMRTDPSANPTLSSLLPIADYFSLTINQLAGIDPLPSSSIIGAHHDFRKKWHYVPLISWEEAIRFKNLADNHKTIPTNVKTSPYDFALEIIEDDYIGFRKETIIIIGTTISPKNHDYVIVHKQGQEEVSFYEYLTLDGVAYLKPLKQDFKTTLLDSNYKLIGVMIQSRLDRN